MIGFGFFYFFIFYKIKGWKSSPLSIEPLLVSDHPKKIGTSDAFYVTIRHVFDYTFLTINIRECSLQIYSIAQWDFYSLYQGHLFPHRAHKDDPRDEVELKRLNCYDTYGPVTWITANMHCTLTCCERVQSILQLNCITRQHQNNSIGGGHLFVRDVGHCNCLPTNN